jgi:hypothetical protein
MREAELHGAVVAFLRYALPRGAMVHHSPNEGKRGVQAQRDLKRHGVRTGWPDLEIIHQGRAYFIELKAPQRDTTPEQKEVHRQLRAAGCHVGVCRSVIDVELTLQGWGFVLSGGVAA